MANSVPSPRFPFYPVGEQGAISSHRKMCNTKKGYLPALVTKARSFEAIVNSCLEHQEQRSRVCIYTAVSSCFTPRTIVIKQ